MMLWLWLWALLTPVTLRVSAPAHSFEPVTVIARVVIPQHEDNREACVALAGGLEAVSCWKLGAGSPLFTERRWIDLPEGDYWARAVLFRTTGPIESNRIHFEVLPRM